MPDIGKEYEKLNYLSSLQFIFEKYPRQNNLFMEQINFLANILMSGWDWQSEERRPGRALELVLEICEEGLKNTKDFSSFPMSFRIGWKKRNEV